VTIHLHLMPRIRINGAKPSLLHLPSWHAQEQLGFSMLQWLQKLWMLKGLITHTNALLHISDMLSYKFDVVHMLFSFPTEGCVHFKDIIIQKFRTLCLFVFLPHQNIILKVILLL
jgi:hypothetical protein